MGIVLPSRLVFEHRFKGECGQYVLIWTVMLFGTAGTQVVDTFPHE